VFVTPSGSPGESQGSPGLGEVKHAEGKSRRSILYCGPLDLRAQAEDRSALRTDTPERDRVEAFSPSVLWNDARKSPAR
jgi:hypothetical protein